MGSSQELSFTLECILILWHTVVLAPILYADNRAILAQHDSARRASSANKLLHYKGILIIELRATATDFHPHILALLG